MPVKVFRSKSHGKNVGLNNHSAHNLVLVKALIKIHWPHSFNNRQPLHALGIDRYSILPSIIKLTLMPQLNIQGATGALYLPPDRHIYRKLIWAKIENGQTHLLAP